MATRYKLDSSRVQSPEGHEIFFSPHLSKPCGIPSLLYNKYWISFPGIKRPGRSVNHPLLFSGGVFYMHSYTSSYLVASITCYCTTLTCIYQIKQKIRSLYTTAFAARGGSVG